MARQTEVRNGIVSTVLASDDVFDMQSHEWDVILVNATALTARRCTLPDKGAHDFPSTLGSLIE